MNFLKEYEKYYLPNAWENYTMEELEWWVTLLTKRASHRSNKEKKEKDLRDAKNYKDMIELKLATSSDADFKYDSFRERNR